MTLRLNGDGSGFTEIKAADTAGDNSIKLPAGNGSANELLKNSGTAGELEYATGVSADTSGNLTATALRGGGVASTMDGAALNAHLTSNRNGLVIQRLDGIAAGQTTGIQFRQEYTTGSGNGRRVGFFGFERASSTSGDQQGHFVMELCPNNSTNIGSNSPNTDTQAFRFTNSGRLQLLKSGGGIDFSGISPTIQNGTVGNNLLDDYEEGVFVPVLRGSGTPGTYTASRDTVGRYIKVGRIVFATVDFNAGNFSGSTGAIQITNLPFTVASDGAGAQGDIPYASFHSAMMYNISFDHTHSHSWYLNPGGTTAYGIESRPGTTWTDWASSNFHNSSIYFTQTFVYMAAA